MYYLKNQENVCFLERRQRSRFAGFSLYISNTGDKESFSLCYKNGPELPPLNFTTTCTLSGRYIMYYNERLDGVTYPGYEDSTNVLTELCEVTVNGKLRALVNFQFRVVLLYSVLDNCDMFINSFALLYVYFFSTGILTNECLIRARFFIHLTYGITTSDSILNRFEH